MNDFDTRLWDLVTAPSQRGMSQLRGALPSNLFTAAARALIGTSDPIVIGTGFPIGGPPETDGPPGAFAIHDALKRIGKSVRIASWQEAIDIFGKVRPDIEYLRIPRQPLDEEIRLISNVSFVAIEICARTIDGTYRDMRHRDISDIAPNFEDFFGTRALVAIGDGGNEFGLGELPPSFFDEWDVIPPASQADHIVPGMVSNFAAYALVAAIERECGAEDLLPKSEDHIDMIKGLVEHGCVDGLSAKREFKVDGYDLSYTQNILKLLRD